MLRTIPTSLPVKNAAYANMRGFLSSMLAAALFLFSGGCGVVREVAGTGQQTLSTFDDTAREIGTLSAEFRRYYRENDARLDELSENVTKASAAIRNAGVAIGNLADGLNETVSDVSSTSEKLQPKLQVFLECINSIAVTVEQEAKKAGNLCNALTTTSEELCTTLASSRTAVESFDIKAAAEIFGKSLVTTALDHKTTCELCPKIIKDFPVDVTTTLNNDIVAPIKCAMGQAIWTDPMGCNRRSIESMADSLVNWLMLTVLAIALFIAFVLLHYLIICIRRCRQNIGTPRLNLPSTHKMILFFTLTTTVGGTSTGCTTYEWQVMLWARSEEVNSPDYVKMSTNTNTPRPTEQKRPSDSQNTNGEHLTVNEEPTRQPVSEPLDNLDPIKPLRWRDIDNITKPAFRYGERYGSETIRAVTQEGVASDQISNAIATARKTKAGERVSLTTRVLRSRVSHALSAEAESYLFLKVAPVSYVDVELLFPKRTLSPDKCLQMSETDYPPADASDQLLVIKLDPTIASQVNVGKTTDLSADKTVGINFLSQDEDSESSATCTAVLDQIKCAKLVQDNRGKALEPHQRIISEDDEKAIKNMAMQFRREDSETRRSELAKGVTCVYFPNVGELSSPFYCKPGSKILIRISNREFSFHSLRCYLSFSLQSSVDVDRLHSLFAEPNLPSQQSSMWSTWMEARERAAIYPDHVPLYPSGYETTVNIALKIRGLAWLSNEQLHYGRR